jgi:hypothetical protein
MHSSGGKGLKFHDIDCLAESGCSNYTLLNLQRTLFELFSKHFINFSCVPFSHLRKSSVNLNGLTSKKIIESDI